MLLFDQLRLFHILFHMFLFTPTVAHQRLASGSMLARWGWQRKRQRAPSGAQRQVPPQEREKWTGSRVAWARSTGPPALQVSHQLSQALTLLVQRAVGSILVASRPPARVRFPVAAPSRVARADQPH